MKDWNLNKETKKIKEEKKKTQIFKCVSQIYETLVILLLKRKQRQIREIMLNTIIKKKEIC